ncbi:MAG: fluoride efflux transporter CrcB [Leptospirillum sp.]
MLRTMTIIACFAVAGAWARYGQTLLIQKLLGRNFPWATLSINVLGSFLMGFLFFATLERVSISPEWRTGILTGGLGAYTTFSTFSIESLLLFENGEPVKGFLYMAVSLLLCFFAVLSGSWISRNL